MKKEKRDFRILYRQWPFSAGDDVDGYDPQFAEEGRLAADAVTVNR